jgi:hypothetical protein
MESMPGVLKSLKIRALYMLSSLMWEFTITLIASLLGKVIHTVTCRSRLLLVNATEVSLEKLNNRIPGRV